MKRRRTEKYKATMTQKSEVGRLMRTIGQIVKGAERVVDVRVSQEKKSAREVRKVVKSRRDGIEWKGGFDCCPTNEKVGTERSSKEAIDAS